MEYSILLLIINMNSIIFLLLYLILSFSGGGNNQNNSLCDNVTCQFVIPTFDLGLELTPPPSPLLNPLSPIQENNNNSWGTPPGYFEIASEICDVVELELALNDSNEFKNPIGSPVKKTIKSVFGKSLLPYNDWTRSFLTKNKKTGTIFKGTSVCGGLYADPFLYGGQGGKRKKKAETFWKGFNFLDGINASNELMSKMSDFKSLLTSLNPDTVVYNCDEVVVQAIEMSHFLVGGVVAENVSYLEFFHYLKIKLTYISLY